MDSKVLQNQVVELSKSKDLAGLTKLVIQMSQNAGKECFCPQAAKMAINISANLLSDADLSLVDLRGYSDAVKTVLDCVPELATLENIQYALVKTYLALGEVAMAVEVASLCEQPRLRLFSSILVFCRVHGLFKLALEMLNSLDHRRLVPSEEDYANVIGSMESVGKDEFPTNINQILKRLSDEREVLESSSVKTALLRAFTARDMHVFENIEISTERGHELCGMCQVTGAQLKAVDLTQDELDDMIELTRRLSLEASRLRHGDDALDEFTAKIAHVLDRPQGLPDIVLDAANIAHINQNFAGGYFRFDQIQSIYNHFRDLGHKCLIVIHSKWLSEKRDLRLFPQTSNEQKPQRKRKKTALPQLGETTIQGREVVPEKLEAPAEACVITGEPRPVPMDLISEWRAAGVLLEVPHGQNDDWFWLHVCLRSMKSERAGKEILLVSNDQMRDHYFRMRNPKSFQKFKSRHVCQYTIQFGEDGVNKYEYHLPIPFSICIQVSQSGNEKIWHVPHRTGSGEIRWLVLVV